MASTGKQQEAQPEGAGEHARQDCSFLSLPLLPCNYNIPEWSGLEGSCKLIQFHCLP